jgi:hypothetical protein
MIKKYILLLFLFILSYAGFSQSWENKFDVCGSEMVLKVLPIQSNGFLMDVYGNCVRHYEVVKAQLDSVGNIVKWRDTHYASYYNHYNNKFGTFVPVYFQNSVSNGNLFFHDTAGITYDTLTFDRYGELIGLDNNNYALLQYHSIEDSSSLILYDSTASEIWSCRFDSVLNFMSPAKFSHHNTTYEMRNSFIFKHDSNNRFLIGGQRSDTSTNDLRRFYYSFLLNINGQGDVEWLWADSSSQWIKDAIFHQGNYYAITFSSYPNVNDRSLFYKFDMSGTLIKSVQINVNALTVISSLDNFLLVGADEKILKIDTAGILIWERELKGYMTNKLIQLEDSSIILAGTYIDYSFLNNPRYYSLDGIYGDAFIMKLSKDGDTIFNSVKFSSDNKEVTVFPNPAKNMFNIETTSNQILLSEIVMYDATGKLIFNSAPINTNKFSVDTDNFPAGLYFLNVKLSNGGRVVKEIIKK